MLFVLFVVVGLEVFVGELIDGLLLILFLYGVLLLFFGLDVVFNFIFFVCYLVLMVFYVNFVVEVVLVVFCC